MQDVLFGDVYICGGQSNMVTSCLFVLTTAPFTACISASLF